MMELVEEFKACDLIKLSTHVVGQLAFNQSTLPDWVQLHSDAELYLSYAHLEATDIEDNLRGRFFVPPGGVYPATCWAMLSWKNGEGERENIVRLLKAPNIRYRVCLRNEVDRSVVDTFGNLKKTHTHLCVIRMDGFVPFPRHQFISDNEEIALSKKSCEDDAEEVEEELESSDLSTLFSAGERKLQDKTRFERFVDVADPVIQTAALCVGTGRTRHQNEKGDWISSKSSVTLCRLEGHVVAITNRHCVHTRKELQTHFKCYLELPHNDVRELHVGVYPLAKSGRSDSNRSLNYTSLDTFVVPVDGGDEFATSLFEYKTNYPYLDRYCDPIDESRSPLVEVGMGCILVSHPHGGRKRISSGKITSISLNRLEHDCPSASGSSGGALFNSRGVLIGLHYASTLAVKIWRVAEHIDRESSLEEQAFSLLCAHIPRNVNYMGSICASSWKEVPFDSTSVVRERYFKNCKILGQSDFVGSWVAEDFRDLFAICPELRTSTHKEKVSLIATLGGYICSMLKGAIECCEQHDLYQGRQLALYYPQNWYSDRSGWFLFHTLTNLEGARAFKIG